MIEMPLQEDGTVNLGQQIVHCKIDWINTPTGDFVKLTVLDGPFEGVEFFQEATAYIPG